MQETGVQFPGQEDGERNGNPLQYSCLENRHGQRSLVGYSPWGLKESDTTEQQTLINYVTNTEEKTPSVTSKRNMARVFRQAFLLHNPQPQALHPAGMSASILTLGQKCPETPWRQ